MVNVFALLSQLASFDHAQCDAILQQRNLEILAAYNPGKAAGARDAVYFGFLYLIVVEGVFLALAVAAWFRKPKRREPERTAKSWTLWKFGGPVFALILLVPLSSQLRGMALYAQTCQTLLHIKHLADR